jgi:hypothetical protein
MTETILTQAERDRRAAYMADMREAVALGRSLEQHLEARENLATQWAQWLHSKMDETHVLDPVEILPAALARVEERAIADARRAAENAAREMVKTMLRRAITS